MSKAVTNEEVEDVLSSIRRLVSEDKRPLAGLHSARVEPVREPEPEAVEVEELGSADQAEDAPVKAEPDRLVLTAALRVAEVHLDEPENPDGAAPLDLGAVARETWIEDEPEAEDAAGAQEADAPLMLFPSEETNPEEQRAEGDDPAMDAVDALVQEALEETSEVENDAEVDGDYGDESYWDDEPEADSPADYDIEAQELRHEEEAARHSQSGALDENALHDAPEIVADPEPYFEPDTPEPTDVATPVEETAEESDNISILPLTAKIAALEAAVGGIKQEWEPDGTEEEDLTSADAAAMAWEDDIDLDARGAPVVDDVEIVEDVENTQNAAEPEISEEPAAFGATTGSDDQLLDEEALRELVSEIVRAELQGALGERITRNVRKLVRREIHRALTAQELE